MQLETCLKNIVYDTSTNTIFTLYCKISVRYLKYPNENKCAVYLAYS